MRGRMGMLCLATLLAVTSARAEELQKPVAETQAPTEPRPNRMQGVGDIDYFLQENLFLGAEGRLRVSSGQYNYTVRASNVSLTDTQSTWSMSGFNVQFFAGLRL